MKTNYNEEEIEILRFAKAKELQVSLTRDEDLKNAVKVAKNTFKKDAVLNIKLTNREMQGLMKKELEVGVSYQDIINALINNYLNNKIKLVL
jgi:predicted DNA binding CopG/RHH family protein